MPSTMTAGEFALLVAALLCCIGFAALVAVLVRVRDAVGDLRREITTLRDEVHPLLRELHDSTTGARAAVERAREDLERFDRVLGSAEAISGAVSGGGRVTRLALSTPVIKTVAIGTGTRRAVRRLRRRDVSSQGRRGPERQDG